MEVNTGRDSTAKNIQPPPYAKKEGGDQRRKRNLEHVHECLKWGKRVLMHIRPGKRWHEKRKGRGAANSGRMGIAKYNQVG